MRAIDADELIEKLRDLYKHKDWHYKEVHFSLADMENNVFFMPTIDTVGCPFYIKNKHDRGDDSLCGLFHREVKCLAVETRQVGRWIDDNCSVCGFYVHHGDARNYCPNCGARMEDEP